ncbi:glycosyltransferase family 2 protein [Uliginosibacterium sp. H1]|uniref:glycosyltransferase family 2 protein n=1 Tax=Uliginosibacterium sp. H1 TaxID=3114757 RepID=UPI002E194A70|nr:glycosyltransferase family 2 protein [Uliginosibacterium sp. H1]
MKLAVVIPVYNHEHAIGTVVEGVRRHGLPVILVDDASAPSCAAELDRLAHEVAGVDLVRLPRNGGKGAAVSAGMRRAQARGFSHALQIDADGQHDTADIPRFVAAAQAQPQAVINGCPRYDESVPTGRLVGRYITHVWVWINTLSLRIRDSMCGFRIYPLASAMPVVDLPALGQRMDFDTEIIVRMDWAGVPVVNLETPVRYPLDGVSHFQMWRDNLRISAMHARLFFAMLPRAPRLLWRHLGGPRG